MILVHACGYKHFQQKFAVLFQAISPSVLLVYSSRDVYNNKCSLLISRILPSNLK